MSRIFRFDTGAHLTIFRRPSTKKAHNNGTFGAQREHLPDGGKPVESLTPPSVDPVPSQEHSAGISNLSPEPPHVEKGLETPGRLAPPQSG